MGKGKGKGQTPKQRQARSRRRHGVNPPSAGNSGQYLSKAMNAGTTGGSTTGNPSGGSTTGNPSGGNSSSVPLQQSSSRHHAALQGYAPKSSIGYGQQQQQQTQTAPALATATSAPPSSNPANALTVKDFLGSAIESMADGGGFLGNPAKYEDATRGALPIDQYYPHFRDTPVVGNVSGSMIGSQPIFATSGGLAPVGMVDARKKVLSDAAKQAYYREKQKAKPVEMEEMPYFETHGAYEAGLNQDYYDKNKLLIAKAGGDYRRLQQGGDLYWEKVALDREAKSSAKMITTLGEKVQEAEEAKADGKLFVSDASERAIQEFYGSIDDIIAMPSAQRKEKFAQLQNAAAMPTLYEDFMKGYIHKDINNSLGDVIRPDGTVDWQLLEKHKSSYLSKPKQEWLVNMFIKNNKNKLTGAGGAYQGWSEDDMRADIEKDFGWFMKANLGMDWITAPKRADGGDGNKGKSMYFFPELRDTSEDVFTNLNEALEYSGGVVNADVKKEMNNKKYILSDGSSRHMTHDVVTDDADRVWLESNIRASNTLEEEFTGEEFLKHYNKQPAANQIDENTLNGIKLKGKLKTVSMGFALASDPDTPMTADQITNNPDAEVIPLAKTTWTFGKPVTNMSQLKETVDFTQGKGVVSQATLEKQLITNDMTPEQKKEAKEIAGIAAILSMFNTDEITFDNNTVQISRIDDFRNEGLLSELGGSTTSSFNKAFNRSVKQAEEVDAGSWDIPDDYQPPSGK